MPTPRDPQTFPHPRPILQTPMSTVHASPHTCPHLLIGHELDCRLRCNLEHINPAATPQERTPLLDHVPKAPRMFSRWSWRRGPGWGETGGFGVPSQRSRPGKGGVGLSGASHLHEDLEASRGLCLSGTQPPPLRLPPAASTTCQSVSPAPRTHLGQ